MKEMKLRKRNKRKKRRMNPVTGSVEKGVDNEIHIYRSMEEADGEVDILQWWRVNKAKLPIMYRFACKILAIPATSAPSERFSALLQDYLESYATTLSQIWSQRFFLFVMQ